MDEERLRAWARSRLLPALGYGVFATVVLTTVGLFAGSAPHDLAVRAAAVVTWATAGFVAGSGRER